MLAPGASKATIEAVPWSPSSAAAEATLPERKPAPPHSAGPVELWAKREVGGFQNYVLLVWGVFTNTFAEHWSDLVVQMDLIGAGSVPIVLLTGAFTGGVLALQSATALKQFGELALTPTLVTKSVLRELGPVITALMVSGRNASGIASELGSMRITDQIDAMRSLGTDPLRKLVTPRMIATIVMLFFLTILSDASGILGGALVSVFSLGISSNTYLHTTYQCVVRADVIEGLTKPVFFGFIISSIACELGMTARGGTQGVGKATTRAVVLSSVLIIVVDYMITRVMISMFG